MKKPIIKIEYNSEYISLENISNHIKEVNKILGDDYHVFGVVKPCMDMQELTDTEAIYHIDGNNYTPEQIVEAVKLVYGSKKSN